jgi:hypothetical protein
VKVLISRSGLVRAAAYSIEQFTLYSLLIFTVSRILCIHKSGCRSSLLILLVLPSHAVGLEVGVRVGPIAEAPPLNSTSSFSVLQQDNVT